ncbi:hypothetical protein BFW38_03325 [Terasakiispira papahanaumokuakeensis]|uniref:Uncharacterized protein n=1 Tax=Terasakiispira papahanaumokuakeensis TaxID=197479 RepID=A0A1E2V6T9_9GAMM|nr:hypothetical protein [Terasakiispira papahanaumokuakeensis]ODC02719.1 hypothetical protein BFW38_03325 [Terasakiispira papahanaumokuakeensis]
MTELALEIGRWPVLPSVAVLNRAISEIQQQGSEWPPSIPQLAVALRPRFSDFGMPEPEQAWREVITDAGRGESRHWSHPAVKEAGRLTGWFDLTQATSQTQLKGVKARFLKHYDVLGVRVMTLGQAEGQGLLSPASFSQDPSDDREQQRLALTQQQVQQRCQAQGLPMRMSAEEAFAHWEQLVALPPARTASAVNRIE